MHSWAEEEKKNSKSRSLGANKIIAKHICTTKVYLLMFCYILASPSWALGPGFISLGINIAHLTARKHSSSQSYDFLPFSTSTVVFKSSFSWMNHSGERNLSIVVCNENKSRIPRGWAHAAIFASVLVCGIFLKRLRWNQFQLQHPAC